MKKLYALLLGLIVMQMYAIAQMPQGGGRPGGGAPGAGGQQRPGGNGGNIPQIGVVYGKLQDAQTRQSVEYASVALLRQRDSGVVTGMLSKSNGDFIFENVPFGAFILRINFMGYKPVFKKVTVTPQNVSQDLGNIRLEANAKSLHEVQVTGQRTAFQMGIDKKVFNVDRNLVSAGGTAADVLKNVPAVNVDIDGNVTVRNASPNIFVDGKPSTLTIDQIPADAIESIELITNPSAKYDAEGMSGIINIVLKKNKKAGFNGQVTAGIGTNDKYNAGGNFNVRQGKFNVSLNYNFNANRNWGDGTTDRTNFSSPNTPKDYTHQTSDSRSGGRFQFGRLGLDYYLDNRNTFSVGQNIVGGNFKNYEDQQNIFSDVNKSWSGQNQRITDNKFGFRNYTTTLGFKHLFAKPNKEFTADASMNLSNNDRSGGFHTQLQDMNGNPIGPGRFQSNISDGKTNFYTLQADYVNPIGTNGKFETGAKATLRDYTSAYDVFNRNQAGDPVKIDSLSTDYKYNEQIYAAYANYSNAIKNFGYQLGLRVEQYVYAGEIPNKGQKFSPTKASPGFFPSVYLSYKLEKDQELQLNYSRRVNRPNFFQLIPYRDISDPQNQREGNPDLKPEYTNSLEFSYMKTWKKHNFLGTLYFRNTNDLITMYSTVIGKDSLLSTFVNAHKNNSYGAELTLKNQVVQGWDITTNVNLYQQELDVLNPKTNEFITNRKFSWMAKINSETKLPANFTFQVSANYQAPTITLPSSSGGGGGGRGGGGGGGGFMMIPTSAQGTIKGLSAVDVALRKDFMKNKAASLTLSLSDVFNTRQFEMDQLDDAFSQHFLRKRESRVLRLTFSYRFGKFDTQLFKRRNNRSNGEGMQMDTGQGF